MPLQHESVLQRYFYRSIRTENLWMEVIEDGRNIFLCGRVYGFPERLGELRDNLTLAEAVKAYGRICGRNRSCGPGIGFVLQDESIPDYSTGKAGGRGYQTVSEKAGVGR